MDQCADSTTPRAPPRPLSVDSCELSPFTVQLRDEEYEDTINFLYYASPQCTPKRRPCALGEQLCTPDSDAPPEMPSPPTTTPFIRTTFSRSEVHTYFRCTPASARGAAAVTPSGKIVATTPYSQRCIVMTPASRPAASSALRPTLHLFDTPEFPRHPSAHGSAGTPFLSPSSGLLFSSARLARLRLSARSSRNTPYAARADSSDHAATPGPADAATGGATPATAAYRRLTLRTASPDTPRLPSPPVSTTLLQYCSSSGLSTVLHTPIATILRATPRYSAARPAAASSAFSTPAAAASSFSTPAAAPVNTPSRWGTPEMPSMSSPPHSTRVLRVVNKSGADGDADAAQEGCGEVASPSPAPAATKQLRTPKAKKAAAAPCTPGGGPVTRSAKKRAQRRKENAAAV